MNAKTLKKPAAPKKQHPAIKSVTSTDHKTTKIEPTAKAKTAAKPKAVAYSFGSKWDGASGVANQNMSRTAIDPTKFGTLPNAALTDRDRKAIEALRAEFGTKAFSRKNLDAGIIRRLGERGFVQHVNGSPVDADTTYKLTNRKVA